MRPNRSLILSGSNYATTTGGAIDATCIIQASAQAVLTGTPTGTLKFQASNDPYKAGGYPTNWSDISGVSVNISASGTALIPLFECSYQWLRPVFTPTGAGVQTVAPIADTGVKQAQTITAVADVAGSLNSTYFLVSSVNLTTKAQKNFYVWLDDGGGVDPAIAGRTGIQVVYSDDDTANTIGGLIRTAMAALTNDWTITGANAAVIVTDKAFGPVTAASDGTAATGFTFGAVTTGVASNLNNTYFYLNSPTTAAVPTNYVIYMNVDSIGTAPVVAGRTSVAVSFASHSTAAQVGTALTTAIDALANFTASGTTTVTVTNVDAGPFTPISDAGATGFTFAVTAGGGLISVNLKSNGL